MDDHDPINHHKAAIVISIWGPNAGQYVACCALSKCGYVGKLTLGQLQASGHLMSLYAVCVERMHTSFSLPIKRYVRRSEAISVTIDASLI